MNEQQLIMYARLVLLRGVALKENEELVINAPITAQDFVRKLTEEAYKTFKSGTVHVNYQDPYLSRAAYRYASEDVLKDVPDYILHRLKETTNRKAAFINVATSFPDLMQGVDQKRATMARKAMTPKTRPYQDKILRTLKWSVVPYPSFEWSKKVYPEYDAGDGLMQFFEDLIKIMRLDEENPLDAFTKHLNYLEKIRRTLNDMHFETLLYKGGGTDLTVELPEAHRWVSGAQKRGKDVFLPNIPTEEIFTVPKKTGVSGTLVATKPMSVRGTTIQPFTVTFKDGKVEHIESDDRSNLEKIMKIDEGASFLGEVALVEETSPVGRTKRLFFQTLLDENSSAHFAFGNAYMNAIHNKEKIKDVKTLTEKHGINRSAVHLDFMVGSVNLEITGIKANGEEIPIMRDGLFTDFIVNP
ncbi:MAG: aminopeptidase [Bacillota bacterium]